MSTFGDLFRYLKIYRKYLGRRMYLIFALTVATALAQGFGITMLLPLLRASQSGSSNPEDMGTAEQYLQAMLETMGIADSMVGIRAGIVAEIGSRRETHVGPR